MDYGNPVEALIPGVQGRVLTVLARTQAELTMRSVAELAGVSANQATVVLNRLVRLGLVERRNVGAAALVRLVRENEAARSVLSLVDLRQGVLARFEREARKIRPAPTCLAVFGSFARGEAHENSDVDVLAVPPTDAHSDGGHWTAALGQWSDRAARIAESGIVRDGNCHKGTSHVSETFFLRVQPPRAAFRAGFAPGLVDVPSGSGNGAKGGKRSPAIMEQHGVEEGHPGLR